MRETDDTIISVLARQEPSRSQAVADSTQGLNAAELPADLRDLVAEVVSQVPRLLTLQDRDPDSPARGSLHPGYWRDKTSDVADMRRQEAALTFAWLWRHALPGNPYHGHAELLHASLRAMGFWTRMQNRDGTFDEWYKGEHGYAATAFSSYAMALAVEALGETLANPLREKILTALRRSGDWLATHHDWFKTNHEAVGVGALGGIGRILDEPSYLGAASRHAQMIAERMHPEGWSREISGLDIGYSFVLVEYMGMHMVLNGDRQMLPALRKAYQFAADFLHPDLTTGAEYGICSNPYFSRVATVILAPHDSIAAGVLRWMNRPSAEPRDTSSTLKDDLRLARYACQPLLATLLHTGMLPRRDVPAQPSAPESLLFERRGETRWRPAAKLLAAARPAYAAWVAPCHGGLTRVAFRQGDGFLRALTDRGYALDQPASVFRNARYSLDVKAETRHQGIALSAPLAPCRFVQPPYWARVALRIATSLPYGPRWSRWLIDRYRARKGTALNQSAAGVAGGQSPFQLYREVQLLEDCVEIVDRIVSRRRTIDPASLFMVLDGPVRTTDGVVSDVDRRVGVAGLFGPAAFKECTIRKRFWLEGERVMVRVRVRLNETEHAEVGSGPKKSGPA